MKKLSLKTYKNKYINIKDIYANINDVLVFNNKKMSYSVYFNILISFLQELIIELAQNKEQVQLPQKMGKMYIKKQLHKRPFHIQIDVN